MFASHIWHIISTYVTHCQRSNIRPLSPYYVQGPGAGNKPRLQGAHLPSPPPQCFPSSFPWYNPYFSSTLAHEYLEGMNSVEPKAWY